MVYFFKLFYFLNYAAPKSTFPNMPTSACKFVESHRKYGVYPLHYFWEGFFQRPYDQVYVVVHYYELNDKKTVFFLTFAKNFLVEIFDYGFRKQWFFVVYYADYMVICTIFQNSSTEFLASLFGFSVRFSLVSLPWFVVFFNFFTHTFPPYILYINSFLYFASFLLRKKD